MGSRGGLDSSGISEDLLNKLRDGIRKSPFQEVARKPSRHGDILIYEGWSREEQGYDVRWISRHPTGKAVGQTMIANRWSSQSQRVEAAYTSALNVLNQIYKEP